MSIKERHSRSRLLQRTNISWTLALGVAAIALLSGVLVWLVSSRYGQFQVLDSRQATSAQQPLSTAGVAATPDTASSDLIAVATEVPNQRDADASGSAASDSPVATHHALIEQQVIDAFSCARAERGLPGYERNVRLSSEAKAILEHIRREPEDVFGDKEPRYSLTGQLLIDFGEQSTKPCSLGGFDVASVDGLDRSSRIGVAVAPLTIYGRIVYLTIIVGR